MRYLEGQLHESQWAIDSRMGRGQSGVRMYVIGARHVSVAANVLRQRISFLFGHFCVGLFGV